MSRKIILILGAGKGISYAVTKKFASEGFLPVLASRNDTKLTELVAGLAAEGIEADFIKCDLSSGLEIRDLFASLISKYGRLDVLLYNAASMTKKSLWDLSEDSLITDFKVNVIGAVTAAQEAKNLMLDEGGTILLTGGGFSMYPQPDFASLGIGKAGIKNLNHSLSKILEKTKIKVGTVTVCGIVKKDDPRYDPDMIAEKFWEIHESGKNGTDIVY